MKESILIILLIDDEADWSRTGEQKHNRVDPGNVIGQKQKPAGGQRFRSHRSHTIENARERHSDESQDTFGGRNWRHRFMVYNRRVAHCNWQIDEGKTEARS